MLNICVCLKQVPDPLSVEIDPLTGQINQERLAFITNPADKSALELALRWREQAGQGCVTVVSYGPERAARSLSEALAVGVDKVQRIWSKFAPENSPKFTAQALAKVLRPLNPNLVLCGSRSADMGTGLVPGYLAEFLGLAQVTGVTMVSFDPLASQIEAERKLERGRREVLRASLPILLGVEAGIAELRYASFPAHLAAQRASIPVMALEAAKPTTELRLIGVTPPRPRPRQIFIPDPSLPVAARIEAILSGGAAVKQKKAGPLEGQPEEQAQRILTFLEQQGFLD